MKWQIRVLPYTDLPACFSLLQEPATAFTAHGDDSPRFPESVHMVHFAGESLNAATASLARSRLSRSHSTVLSVLSQDDKHSLRSLLLGSARLGAFSCFCLNQQPPNTLCSYWRTSFDHQEKQETIIQEAVLGQVVSRSEIKQSCCQKTAWPTTTTKSLRLSPKFTGLSPENERIFVQKREKGKRKASRFRAYPGPNLVIFAEHLGCWGDLQSGTRAGRHWSCLHYLAYFLY